MTKRAEYLARADQVLNVTNKLQEKLRATLKRVSKVPRQRVLPNNWSTMVRMSDSKEDFIRDLGIPVQKVAKELAKQCNPGNDRQGVAANYIRSLVNVKSTKSVAVDPRFGKPWRYFAVPGRGFAIGRFLDTERFGAPIFFIEVICAARQRNVDVAGAMFRKIEDEAQKHGCTKLWLAALEGAIGAYRQRGFDFGPVCEHDTAYPPGALLVHRERLRGNWLMSPQLPARFFRIKHVLSEGSNHVNGDPPDFTYLMTKCLHAAVPKRRAPVGLGAGHSALTSKSR